MRKIDQPSVSQLSTLPITHQEIISEDYLDVMGHMNVAWYLHLFSQATRGVFQWIGFDIAYMQANNAGTFALEGHVRYLAEVLVGHHVTLRTRVIDRSASRCQLLHFMFNDSNQKLAATFETLFAHIDMDIRRMAPFPDPIAEKVDQLVVLHRALKWEPPVCGVIEP